MEKILHFIVVGCGRVGSQLANRLFKRGFHVTVIDIAPSAFDNLDPGFQGRTLEGDVLSQDLLHRAGIERADGIAIVTNSDTLNAVIGHVARTVYHVPNVVCRNYEPRYQALYDVFGLQEVNSAVWGAQRIEEMLEDTTLRVVFSAGNGEVELYEVLVPAAWDGRTLDELLVGCACTAALTRAGRAAIPAGDHVLHAGDILHLSATREGIEQLRIRLNGKKRK